MAKKGNRIQCLDRALDVLETVAAEGECGLTELARRLKLHVATASNIAKTLALRRYLLNVNRRYRLGPAARTLAGSQAGSVAALLAPFVREAALRSGESAIAAVAAGFEIEIAVSCPGSGETTAHFPSRTVAQPLDYATGRVLAAFGPERLWPEFISRHAGSARAAGEWLRELRGIKNSGLSIVRRPGRDAVSSVAGPVRCGGGEAIAAIGISCPNVRFNEEKLALMRAETLRACAGASACCGYSEAKTKKGGGTTHALKQ